MTPRLLLLSPPVWVALILTISAIRKATKP